MRSIDSRGVRVAVACFSVLSWVGMSPEVLRMSVIRAAEAPPAKATIPPAAREAIRAFEIAEAESKRPGADPSDIAFRAAKLGFDANRIFAFVRDKTRLEPYAGMLRGARGVLAARAGNSLDRALLLRALLTEAGIPCRLVQGVLPPEKARLAIQQFLSPPNAPAAKEDADDAGATKVLQRAGIPDSVIAEFRDRTAARSAALWRSVSSQAAERSQFLLPLLNQAGLKPPGADAMQQALASKLATHYWVQRQDPEKGWIDFDPTFPDLAPGQTSGGQGNPIDEVPADQRHQFDLTLVYRTKQDGGTKEEVVLKQTVDAADAPFEPMAFAVQSADANLPSAYMMSGPQKADLIHKMKKFQGVLHCGSEMTAGRPFDLEGNTYDVEPGGVIANAAGVGNSAVGNLGGFGGALGGGGAQAKPANTFVDLRVVMTIRAPGCPPITQERALATAADPAPPLINWEIFLQPGLSPTKLIEYQLTDYLARQLPYLQAIFEPSAQTSPLPDHWPFPINSASLAMLRNSALRRTLAGIPGVVPLMDHANLFLSTYQIRVNPAGNGTEARRNVDLVEMALNFVPKTAADEPAALAAAVKQGVTESTIEETFLANAFAGHGVSSASGQFDLARAAGAAVQVVKPGNAAAALTALGWTDSDAKALASAEPADQLIVATSALDNQPPAWWTVSPDGATVARTRGGLGDALEEYAEITANVTGKVLCFLEMVEAMEDRGNLYKFESLLLCAGMQSGFQAIEWATEGMEAFEGIGVGLFAIDAAVFTGRALNEPDE